MNIVGIDIGGTKISLGILDGKKIIFKTKLKTDPFGSFENKMNEISNIIEMNSISISAIGIGCTGPIDYKNGLLKNPYTLNAWNNKNIIEFFRKKFDVPVFLDNDVNVALLGVLEMESLSCKSAMMLSFGTGVGGAVWNSKGIFRQENNNHPEFGHIPLKFNCEEWLSDTCYCNQMNCLENIASGTAIEKIIKEQGFSGFDHFYNCVDKSDSKANEIIRNISTSIDQALNIFKVIFNPDIFFIGGGVMDYFYDYYISYSSKSYLKSTFYKKESLIKQVKSSDQIALVGAVSMAKYRSNL